MKRNSILNGAIGASLHFVNLNVVDYKVLAQHLAGIERDISHLLEAFGRFHPEPFIHLLSTKSFFALLNKKILEFLQLKFSNISFGDCIYHGMGLKCKFTLNLKLFTEFANGLEYDL